MEKTEATHSTLRKGRTSGLFLTPTQVGLAVGVAAVGCITAFGAGVILGMWYTASEQITPYIAAESKVEERPSPAPGATDTKQDNLPVTFYSALVHDDGQDEGALAPGTPKKPSDVAQKRVQDVAPKTPPPTGIAAVVEAVTPPPAPPRDTPPAATAATGLAAPSTPPPAPTPRHESAAATTPAPAATPPTVRRESQTAEATTPAASPAPTAQRETTPAVTAAAKPTATPTTAARRDASVPEVAASPPAPPTRPTRRETAPVVAVVVVPPAPTPRLTDTDIPARPGVETTATPSSVPKRASQKAFSVQVGSFRSQEHATRLLGQLAHKGYQAHITTFTGPDGASWYRVRIGSFSDRSAATQTAQQLKTQNQGSTVVAVD